MTPTALRAEIMRNLLALGLSHRKTAKLLGTTKQIVWESLHPEWKKEYGRKRYRRRCGLPG